MIYTKYTALVLLLCHAVSSVPPSKQIHDAYSLHPVEINDFYTNPENAEPSANNIEDTIAEVQELIKSNPKLPRLTRGEIVDIIENITKTDSNALNTREEGKRALMVVMPFTAGSAQGDDIKELYTRTPVTHIIGGQAMPVKKEQKKRRRPTIPPTRLSDEEIGNLYKSPLSSTTLPSTMLTKITKYLVTSTTTTSSPITKARKVKQTSPIVHTSTTATSIQFRPKLPQKLNNPQRKYPNHKYPDDITSSDSSKSGIHIINPPQLSPMHFDSQFKVPFTISLSKLQPVTESATTTTTTTERNFIDDIPIPENYKHVVKDLNLLIDTNNQPHHQPTVEKLTTTKEILTSPRYYPTSTKMPDISNVAENLSADMKDLLMNFGLLNDPNKKPTIPTTSTENVPYQLNAEIKPESYLSFKPLPDSAPSRSEMEEFLARFGLGRSAFRSQKSIDVNKPKKELGKNAEINMDAIPNNMKHVMEDLGFATNIEKIQSLNQISPQSVKHIFNPSVQTANEQELQKLSKLLDMIKDLGKLNGNLTEENFKNIDVDSLRELIGDFNGHKFVPLNEKDAPNPLNYENAEKKNGIKRQEDSTTTSTTASTTESATERTDNPSLIDLEASFGNQPDVVMPTTSITTTTEPTTTTPRTGFYYLLDWNSFLELDNQLGRKVNLRFQPHAGDPRQFLSVSVP